MSERAITDHRSQGRELAFAVLCHIEVAGAESVDVSGLFDDPPQGDEPGEAAFAELVAVPRARRFAEALLEPALPHLANIDERIRSVSKRWRLERMDLVDRNVLRLATAELMFGATKVPSGVVVAEAVRIAARYGNERSAKFVNGVLNAIADAVPRAYDLSRTEGGDP